MKKISTLIMAAILGCIPAISQSIFSTEFKTIEDFNQWTVVDVNNDGCTWKFDDWASPSYVFYSYSSANSADDWMISPAITSEKSGSLAIKFLLQGSSYGEKLEVFYGNDTTVVAMTNRGTEVIDLNGELSSSYFLIDVEAGKPVHIGFHACSDPDKYRLYICNVDVTFTDNPVDLKAEAIVSPVSAEGLNQEAVTVKIKNEGKVDVSTFDVSFAINGDTIATETVNQTLAAGAETDYTFTAKASLSTPRELYTITAWVNNPDDINADNNACSSNVRHKAPASIPYFMGFESNEMTDEIKIFNLNEDEGDWEVYTDPWWNLARTGNFCLAYNYDKNNNGDDWAILEPVNVEAGYYALKFWYAGSDNHPENLAVYYGNEATPAAMTNKVVEYAGFLTEEYTESINIIYFDKPQKVYFGFYAFSNKDENWITIDDISFDKVSAENVDLTIGEISNPGEYSHARSNKTIKFNVRSLGIKDTDANITVSIDGQVISEISETIKAQEIKEFAIEGKLSALTEGKHIINVQVTSTDDSNADNNAKAKEFRILNNVAYLWDFEDAKLPEAFTFVAEDEGTVSPSAGGEFNELGWGIINIQNHELYGEHVMGGTSWLDGTEQADRWCKLPKVKITSDSAYLTWDAMSFNASYPENYAIKVSDYEDVSWWYSTEAEIINETGVFKTRGVDLSEYAGKEVYIAFQLKTANGDCLILDNIGLYGTFDLSGIEDVATDDMEIIVANGYISINSENVENIAIYDLSGRIATQSTANTISTESLNSGIYIVKVATSTGITTQKIAIK